MTTQFTVEQASPLVGKSKQTIYRHLKSGKLSRNSDKLIDKAELLRVYGALVSHEDNKQTQDDINVIALLQQQVTKLEDEVKEIKADSREREANAIEREKRLMALLENKSGIEPEKNKGGLFGKLFK